jgi:DNA-directed RNA polymerase I, II, and III subunit RPABC2
MIHGILVKKFQLLKDNDVNKNSRVDEDIDVSSNTFLIVPTITTGAENTEVVEVEEQEEPIFAQEEEVEETPIEDTEVETNAGLNKALETYRKLIEKKGDVEPLTEKDQQDLEKKLKEIEEREIIDVVQEHEPVEIPCEKEKITIGPPTLTRFEKARIMGARALQLSLGAPPFIPIPKTARISLDISMEELDQRVIPITIRRVLPNGDYQNIPIDYFEK